MADNKQFGSPQQFGNKAPGNPSGDDGHCAECEAMLADVLDGTLSPTDQAAFDAHIAHCGPCAQMLADARRGAAWLEMLRDPRPEPPAELLERILTQTSGTQTVSHSTLHALHGTSLLPAPPFVQPALAPGYGSLASGKVLPFRTRFGTSVRHIVLQPRLAMTAAMAFFSIALTLNLTGVRLQDIHASDFHPGNIQRVFSLANAHVAQYYEGLRVVYELESRVHDLQTTTDPDVPAGTQVATPNSPADASPNADQPATEQPATDGPESGQPGVDQPSTTPSNQPDSSEQPDQPAAPQPGHSQPVRKQPAPKAGISRREGFNQSRHLVAATVNHDSFRNTVDALGERGQA